MVSTYEGQDEDGAMVIPNTSITPGKIIHLLISVLYPTFSCPVEV